VKIEHMEKKKQIYYYKNTSFAYFFLLYNIHPVTQGGGECVFNCQKIPQLGKLRVASLGFEGHTQDRAGRFEGLNGLQFSSK